MPLQLAWWPLLARTSSLVQQQRATSGISYNSNIVAISLDILT